MSSQHWGLPLDKAQAAVDTVMARYPNPHWSESPAWLRHRLAEAADDAGYIGYTQAHSLMAKAATPKMIGGANAGMASIRDAWRGIKVLLPG